jgi:hypothetical protein
VERNYNKIIENLCIRDNGRGNVKDEDRKDRERKRDLGKKRRCEEGVKESEREREKSKQDVERASEGGR